MMKCWFYRWQLGYTLTLRENPAPAQVHLQNCLACQDWLEREQAIERLLTKPVNTSADPLLTPNTAEVFPDFMQRLQQRIERAEARGWLTLEPTVWAMQRWLIGLSLTLVVLFFLSLRLSPSEQATTTEQEALQMAAEETTGDALILGR